MSHTLMYQITFEILPQKITFYIKTFCNTYHKKRHILKKISLEVKTVQLRPKICRLQVRLFSLRLSQENNSAATSCH